MILSVTKKIPLACFAIVLVLQLVSATSLLFYTARTKSFAEKTGRTITLSCMAYDPVNPFKGRYVRLSFEEEDVDRSSLDGESFKIKKGESSLHEQRDFYFLMKKGRGSLWQVRGVRSELPEKAGEAEGQIFIKGKMYSYQMENSGYDSIHITFPFDEYYLQENFARYVDSISADDFNALKPELSLYVDKRGRCIQKGLTVFYQNERISIEDYCRTKLKLSR